MTRSPLASFSTRLLDWFDTNGRHDLPWKNPRSAYRVWLSEIMLQQTQVRTVIPYFERFVREFPTLPSLARSDLDQVFTLWTGLGYYARARNLHRAAKICVEIHGGDLPQNLEALCALPGIGRSTAGAILAQAYQLRFPILDGNVKRTLCRYHGIVGWPGDSTIEKKLWSLSNEHLPETRLADYTQAIMDFGATLCTRRAPACTQCPLKDDCIALREGNVEQLPTTKINKPLPQRNTLMLVLRDDDGHVLLTRRPPTGVWPGLWSLPEAASIDEAHAFILKHSKANTKDSTSLPTIDHTFSHYRLRIMPLLWHHMQPIQRISDTDQQRWHALSSLDTIGLPAPVRKLLENLL